MLWLKVFGKWILLQLRIILELTRYFDILKVEYEAKWYKNQLVIRYKIRCNWKCASELWSNSHKDKHIMPKHDGMICSFLRAL